METLTDNEKYLLALFLKRLTFNMVYEVADHDTHENMKVMAYSYLEVIEKLQEELRKQGFAPR